MYGGSEDKKTPKSEITEVIQSAEAPKGTKAQVNVKTMLRDRILEGAQGKYDDSEVLKKYNLEEYIDNYFSIWKALTDKGILDLRAECLAVQLLKENITSPTEVFEMTEDQLRNIGGFTNMDIQKLKKSWSSSEHGYR